MCLWRLLPLAALALGLSACAGAQLGSGKNAFSAVTTEHFTLYTDLEPERAEEQGLRLEQLLSALQETAWESKSDLPLKMNVIMFADSNDFDRYGYGKIVGYALPEELYEPWIVLSAPRFGEDYSVVAHELTHAMAFQSISHMPRWASEGLASYFESAHFHDDGSFQVGAVPKNLYLALHTYGWDRPSQLLSGHESGIDHRFYASSWLLVHYLMTRQADAFVVFQDQLARGLDTPDAWQRAFPTLSPEQLDEAVSAYVDAGVYESYVFELTPHKEVPKSTRRLSAAEEHVLLAILWKNCEYCSEQERGHWRLALERALELEPTNVWAGAFSISQELEDKDSAFERAQALSRAHAEHWLSWISLGAAAMKTGALPALSAQPESDPGTRAARLAPRQPYALALQAWTHAFRGEREQARALIKAAQRLQPSNPNLLVMRATMLAGLSACTELREVIALMAENVHGQVPRSLPELRKLAERCREPEASNVDAPQEAAPE